MAPFTEHTVKYDEGKKEIAYIAAGPTKGPLLIFIHGWPAIASTWKPQLDLFASLGFYVVAPDMPGYGKSTANKVYTDYAHENIISGLLALLADTGRTSAVWLGHDWGSGVVSSLVAVHPEVCRAMVWMAVPYACLELGKVELLKYANREMYPEDKFPHAQWDYMAYYEESFDAATDWFDKNIPGFMKIAYSRGSSSSLGKPAFTSNVRSSKGWFGGVEKVPDVPLEATSLDQQMYEDLVAAMERTTFFPADAYYMNHGRNREFNLTQRKNNGVLHMPCLYIQARYDTVCDTANSRLLEPMQQLCENFSFANVDAGHWVALEAPVETNSIITKWLVQEVGDYWPGGLQNALVTRKR